MDTRIIYGFFIIVMLLVTSCTDEGIVNQNSSDQENAKPSAELVNDKLAQHLVDLGFQPDKIKTFNKGYLVEGDIYFSKDRLRREISKNKSGGKEQDPEIQQWATNYAVSINNVDDIVISVASGVPSSWETAVNQAVNEWNSINDSNVHMIVNNSASNSDITVSMDSNLNGTNYVAYADFPSNGEPGSYIRINSDYNWLSSSQKLHNMVHELGHDLGFRHTNWDARNESEPGGRLNFTPETDDNSVMNGGTGRSTWNGFSIYDIYGTQVMYPESLGGTIVGTDTRSERSSTRGERDTFYFVVEYSVTGTKFQHAYLQRKVNGAWQYLPASSRDSESELWVVNEREDTMEGTEIRVEYENYKADVIAYSPSYTVEI